MNQLLQKRDKKMIEKVLVDGRVVLVSASTKQIESCFDTYANRGEDETVEVKKATSAELKNWKEGLN